jgi:hypothetical protein
MVDDFFDPRDKSEFEYHQKAAKNHLATITAKEPQLTDYSKPSDPGPKLCSEDMRVLAATIEMEDQLDPQLGRCITGVSRTALRMVCGYDRNQQVKYRLDKLEDNRLVKTGKADDLPISSPGPAPGYAVATSSGRKTIIEDLELLPILRRERNTETALFEVNELLEDVHRELVLTTGRIMKLVNILSQQSELDIDLSDKEELRKYATQTFEDWEDNPDIFKPETLFERLLEEEDQHIQKVLIDMWMNKDEEEYRNED